MRHPLSYGVADSGTVGVAVGDSVLDLTAATARLLPTHAELFARGSLDPFLAAGRPVWTAVHAAVGRWMADGAAGPFLRPVRDVTPRLPFTVADYADFYGSEHHAAAVGRVLRPGQPPVPANWRLLPAGYHGRSGSVVVSGTPIRRPCGQRGPGDFGPSRRLDFEAEVGFVVGAPAAGPVRIAEFAEHVFGVCLVNDWSARDIQAFEAVPLGPFLGKSFATSISPWIVPLDALSAARIAPPARDPAPLPYLDDADEPWGLDILLTVTVNGAVVSRPPFAAMYWTAAQQLAHLTSNGAPLRTGDLLASGTVSGPGERENGCLLELGADAFLADGDTVTVSALARGHPPVWLGEVTGRVEPAIPSLR